MMSATTPDDPAIRDFLTHNPDVLRDFLTRESRAGAPWLDAYMRKLVRIGALSNIDTVLRGPR